MPYEYKLPKITIDDVKAMTPAERLKTLRFEEEMRKTKEAQGFSWNKKGWPADVLQDEEKAKWVTLGSPKGNESVEDIVGLKDNVRRFIVRGLAAGPWAAATRRLKRLKEKEEEAGKGGRRTRKTRRRLTHKRKHKRV